MIRRMIASTGKAISLKKGTPALPGAKLPAAIICSTWPIASPSRKIALTITTAALKSRLRQKLTQAVAPIARSAMPTSNWKGLGSQPMSAAAISGKKR